MKSTDRVLLNLGCGLVAPKRWRNYDASLHQYVSSYPLLDKALCRLGLTSKSKWPTNVEYLDLNRGWPFVDESVDVVYSHHVFEHLSSASATLYLREAHRVLRTDGVLRLVVPDLLQHAQQYVNRFGELEPTAAEQFLSSMNLQPPLFSNPLRALYEWYSGHPSLHKTMHDERTLTQLLTTHGFHDILRCSRSQSPSIPEISDVEFGSYDCSLYLEARPNK